MMNKIVGLNKKEIEAVVGGMEDTEVAMFPADYMDGNPMLMVSVILLGLSLEFSLLRQNSYMAKKISNMTS